MFPQLQAEAAGRRQPLPLPHYPSSLVHLPSSPLLQAEAAAAADLLSLWRQRRVLGKPLEARNYNLGLARYA